MFPLGWYILTSCASYLFVAEKFPVVEKETDPVAVVPQFDNVNAAPVGITGAVVILLPETSLPKMYKPLLPGLVEVNPQSPLATSPLA